MQESLDASLVRLRTVDGRVVGAGFLVGERQVMTCAHVVMQALGLSDHPADAPQGLISLDLPLVAPRTLLTARVVLWYPALSDGSGDIAGLELQSELPAGAEVVHFAPAEDVWEHPFRAFGFPVGFDDGVWATGHMLGRQATGWVMIEDVKAQGHGVVRGFSGTPVWDTQAKGVVGMVIAASRPVDTKAAFVIPLDVLVAAWPLITVPQGEPRNPYKGLRPFTQKDAGDFFGREPVVEKLVEVVKAFVTEQPASTSKRLLTIIGPSGSGKSSVIMAGLLPRLQHGALPGSKEWAYLDSIVPGKHPLEALASTLKPHFPDTSFKTLREDLEDDAARGLHLLATQLAKQPGTRVVFLIDQFEELFTQTESEDERQRFIRLLLTASGEPRGPVTVLLTLRADFFDRPMQYPDLFHLVDMQHLSLLSMDPANLRRVIEQPAALSDVQVTFEGDLVLRLLSEVQGQVGALPLLQFTLDQLFEQRRGHLLTLEAYHEMGGVKGALTRHAEATYATLPSEEHRKLARALFLRLLEPGTSEQDTTRRRAALSEFTLTDATQTRLLRETIDAFIAARLLTTNEVAGTTTIEVSHEALIREWTRLSGWLLEARQDILLQQTISKDVAEWERRGKPRDRLYRGSQLKEARTWARRNMPSGNEVAFLRASAAQHMRTRVSMVAIALALLLSFPLGQQVLHFFLPSVTNLQDYGPGSLRQAIDTASSGDTISFDPRLSGIIMLTRDLHISKNLTIRGPTAHTLSISSGKSGHIVQVLPGFSVTISDLTFRDSKTTTSFIDNGGTLTLTNSTVSGNSSTQGDGGGIYNVAGTLTLTNSTVSGNSATQGGGIVNQGMLTLTNSTVSGNSATQGGGIGNQGMLTLTNSTVSGNFAKDGGGIFNTLGSTLTLSNSTASGNSATQGNGGGIDNFGTLTLANSTASGNSATQGGGIFIQSVVQNGPYSQADLTFSTIYGNMASVGGDIAVEDIAGYSSNGAPKPSKQVSHVRISNSIVAAHSAHPGPDISATLISYGYNLFQDNSGATFDPATSKQHGTDKTLSVNDLTKLFADPVGLRDNGGPTRTYALGPGSPALDQIPLVACHVKGITTDQRGVKRPDGNERVCDIGAYEYMD